MKTSDIISCFLGTAVVGILGEYLLVQGTRVGIVIGVLMILCVMVFIYFIAFEMGKKSWIISGIIMDFNDMPENKEFVFKGCIQTEYTMTIAVIEKTGMSECEPLRCVKNFPVKLAQNTNFIRKGCDVYKEER